MNNPSKYSARGVSANKEEVHKAIKHLEKGLFPNAFCKILPDLVANDSSYVNIMHADTAGSKTSLAYIYYKETGDISVWRGIVQDAIVMNIDDMACVGCADNIIISSTIGRNKHLISGEVIAEIIAYTQEFIEEMGNQGVKLTLAGGETADVGDIVRTIDVGITAFGRIPKKEVIEIQIEPGMVIVGFASYGKAHYESNYNGGMGSNGLTSARHDVFAHEYASKYPESYDPAIDPSLVYAGTKKLTDTISIEGQTIPLGKLVLSPTRTYLPVINTMLKEGLRPAGMIHCSGGGQTKVMKFVRNVHIIKDTLFDIPPLFQLIEEESRTSRQEMYEVFNMGHRLECYVTESQAKNLIEIGSRYGIDTKIIGHVESSTSTRLTIKDNKGQYIYLS